MLQVIPSFSTNYSNSSPFNSANTYEKHIVSEEYCIARHDDRMCILTICRYHIIPIGKTNELLQKLDALCFNDLHVDCLYTLFKYRFSGDNVVQDGLLFQNCAEGSSIQPLKQRSGQKAQHRANEGCNFSFVSASFLVNVT